jgi:Ca2+-binding EF-hand superfamily protein
MEPRPRDEIEAVFKYFDKDGSGFIDENELYLTVQRLNPNVTKSNVASMLKRIDKDKSGKISIEGLYLKKSELSFAELSTKFCFYFQEFVLLMNN